MQREFSFQYSGVGNSAFSPVMPVGGSSVSPPPTPTTLTAPSLFGAQGDDDGGGLDDLVVPPGGGGRVPSRVPLSDVTTSASSNK